MNGAVRAAIVIGFMGVAVLGFDNIEWKSGCCETNDPIHEVVMRTSQDDSKTLNVNSCCSCNNGSFFSMDKKGSRHRKIKKKV